MQNSNFRYDINGLRAYAVILVVLFHFGIFGFSAGFIGVDIFFVISGFLMTNIVVKSLERGDFSLLNFYLARGIRIVPALFVVSTIVLILGWFFLLPTDYKALAKHTLSSINFFSNIVYWRESGYFDTDSHNKALLHTWSLSVEWQFYLVFPIIVALIYKIKKSRKFLLFFIILGTILSFILSIIITAKNPSAGFFLLPTRAWEMLIGGLILFIPKEKVPYKKPLEIIGFSLIAISCYIFSTNTLWPSYNALLPALGTFLILLAHQQNSVFTKGSVFQWLGNNSYSIYLWHWPIVFFLHYFYKNDDYLFIASGITFSIILGWISYTYIENPTRKKLSSLSMAKAYIFWFSLIGLLCLICLIIFKYNGIKTRFSEEIQNIEAFSYDKNPRQKECLGDPNSESISKCSYGSGPIKLIVVGDSYADAMLNGIINSLPPKTSLVSYNISSCQTIIGLRKIDNSSYNCGNLIPKIINDIKKYSNNTPILIINMTSAILSENPDKTKYVGNYSTDQNIRTTEIQKAYINTIHKFSKEKIIYLVGATPVSKYSVPETFAKIFLYRINNDLILKTSDFKKINRLTFETQKLLSKNDRIKIIDLTNFFCDQNNCHFVKDNKPLFYDKHHLNWSSSLQLSTIFRKEIFDN